MRDRTCNHCPLCGAGGTLLHEGVADRLYGVGGQWNFRQCENFVCGLVWIDPKPLESDLHHAYATYYTHGDNDAGLPSPQVVGRWRRTIAAIERFWLRALFLGAARNDIEAMYLADLHPGRLLEVGCGNGHLLARMRDRGWFVEGQDVDAKAADHARRSFGVTVHRGDLISLTLPAESYDAVVMNHVIEHAYDPTALVRECRRLLKRGGLLVMTTPNPHSYGHRKFGPSWRGLEPPRHLQLFPASLLARMASLAGFGQCEAWTTPARAGSLLATSANIRRSGTDPLRGRTRLHNLIAAAGYQLAARVAHLGRADSGEEAVLRAVK
jgi:SAM-dependent methyltransferase